MSEANPFFTLTVSLHAFQANFRFCFISKANAEAAYAAVKRAPLSALNLEALGSPTDHDDVEISDDFGNGAMIDRNLIMCVVLSDAQRNSNADVMTSFLQQKAQLHLNKKLMTDPEIKAAQSIAMPGPGGVLRQ